MYSDGQSIKTSSKQQQNSTMKDNRSINTLTSIGIQWPKLCILQKDTCSVYNAMCYEILVMHYLAVVSLCTLVPSSYWLQRPWVSPILLE